MKYLKFLIFILLAITIFSCYSIESDCYNDGDILWEATGSGPYLSLVGHCSIVATSDGNIWVGRYDQLFLSTNNGDTWDKKTNTPHNAFLINVNPTNGCFFASTTFNGLFRSSDNGENWEHVIESLHITGIIFTISGEIYIGGIKYLENAFLENEIVLYYSNDNGNTWTNKSGGLPNSTYIWSLALGKDGTLYAGFKACGVYHSTDSGNTWLPWLPSSNIGFDYGAEETEKIIFNPLTNDIFVISEVMISSFPSIIHHLKVYRSTNLGKDWKLENSGLPNEYCYDVSINPKTGQMFIATESGVYRTKNYPR
jgi:hypothetical protein